MQLVLNYATSAAGSIKVELQDADGTPIKGHSVSDCDEILGDEIERVVNWRGGGDLSKLAGRPVRLRFTTVNCADFYSVQFRQRST